MVQAIEGAGRWRVAGWGLAAALLALPAVAMLVTGEVAWGPGDFLLAALLLGGTGLALEGATRMARTGRARVLAALGVLGGLLLVWAELAVGIFS